VQAAVFGERGVPRFVCNGVETFAEFRKFKRFGSEEVDRVSGCSFHSYKKDFGQMASQVGFEVLGDKLRYID
jgi:hypothetical protein